MILKEFLPLFVGQAMVDDILTRGRRFYTPTKDPFIPVEFQGARSKQLEDGTDLAGLGRWNARPRPWGRDQGTCGRGQSCTGAPILPIKSVPYRRSPRS
jgi:hypothetical protein